MGAKKIVIDINTLISAIGWNGKPRELFRQVIDKKFELQISIKQIAEIMGLETASSDEARKILQLK